MGETMSDSCCDYCHRGRGSIFIFLKQSLVSFIKENYIDLLFCVFWHTSNDSQNPGSVTASVHTLCIFHHMCPVQHCATQWWTPVALWHNTLYQSSSKTGRCCEVTVLTPRPLAAHFEVCLYPSTYFPLFINSWSLELTDSSDFIFFVYFHHPALGGDTPDRAVKMSRWKACSIIVIVIAVFFVFFFFCNFCQTSNLRNHFCHTLLGWFCDKRGESVSGKKVM